MNNVMVDLETLGNTPGCVVLSIGAVTFDPDEGVGSSFYTLISVEDSLRHGLTVEASTLRWWSEQDKTTYKEALGGKGADALLTALLNFNTWLECNASSEHSRKMWGNGADFDISILLACYRKVGVEAPWKFWNHRCYRTLKNLRPDVRAEQRNSHNALDDARNQAEHAVAILRAMQ